MTALRHLESWYTAAPAGTQPTILTGSDEHESDPVSMMGERRIEGKVVAPAVERSTA
jgi:hypothetical protein